MVGSQLLQDWWVETKFNCHGFNKCSISAVSNVCSQKQKCSGKLCVPVSPTRRAAEIPLQKEWPLTWDTFPSIGINSADHLIYKNKVYSITY